jgi:hypothetical protein
MPAKDSVSHEPEEQCRDADSFFVWRTPLLSFNELEAFGEGLSASARESIEPFEVAVESDKCKLRARLREIVARREVREALFLTGTSLRQAKPGGGECDERVADR